MSHQSRTKDCVKDLLSSPFCSLSHDEGSVLSNCANSVKWVRYFTLSRHIHGVSLTWSVGARFACHVRFLELVCNRAVLFESHSHIQNVKFSQIRKIENGYALITAVQTFRLTYSQFCSGSPHNLKGYFIVKLLLPLKEVEQCFLEWTHTNEK